MSKTQDESGFQLYTEADSPTGVDDCHLLKQLKLTPTERLQWLEKVQGEPTAIGCPGIFTPGEWEQILIAEEARQLQEMREILDAHEAERLRDEAEA